MTSGWYKIKYYFLAYLNNRCAFQASVNTKCFQNYVTYGYTDRQTDGQTDKHKDRQTDKQRHKGKTIYLPLVLSGGIIAL